MNKLNLSYFPYELKFQKPFETAKGKLYSRKGFIIKIKNENGVQGTGDICPFAEFGSETYEDAINFIKNFKHDIKLNLDDIEDTLGENFSDAAAFPACRCGLEQALLTLISAENDLSLNYLFNRKSKAVIKVNAVIDFRDPVTSAALAENFIEDGYTTIKVKVGRKNFKEDLACISHIRKSAGSGIKIRLDANGKWNLAEAEKNLNAISEFNIEYIEQPVSGFDEFQKLIKRTNIPLAADEGIRSIDDAAIFIKNKSVKYLILKPMLLGGILPVMKIYDEAVKNDIGVVVTSSLESGIGRGYAVFAASLIEEDIAHGLATQGLFESKLLPESYVVKHGEIRLE